MPGTPTPADEIFSAELSRAMDFFAVVNDGADRIVDALDSQDDEFDAIVAGILRKPGKPFQKARIREANRASVASAFELMVEFGIEAATEEAGFLAESFDGESKPITAAEIREIARTVKFLGQTLSGHRNDFRRFRGGLIADELSTMQQARKAGAMINPSVRLTSLERGRTSIRAVANAYLVAVREAVRKKFRKRNRRQGWVSYWAATLDNRTTIICINNDAAIRAPGDKAWSNGYAGPYPAHHHERSIIMDMPKAQALKLQKARPSKEEWFDSLSEADQKKLVGVKRLEMLQKGQVTLDELVTSKGRKKTLDQLGRSIPAAARMKREAVKQAARASRGAA